MIISRIRKLCGFVNAEIEGYLPERILTRFMQNGIPVWNILKKDSTLCVSFPLCYLRRVSETAKEIRLNMSVKKKIGVPFFLYKYRKRFGIIAGIILFSALIIYSKGFLWSISITGNEKTPDSDILSALQSEGVIIGAKLDNLDFNLIKNKVAIILDDVTYISLNTSGTNLNVIIHEGKKPPACEDISVPVNIIASDTGQILRINTFAGQAVLHKNDTVMAGELVVSGICEDGHGNNYTIHASAEVIALVHVSRTFSCPDTLTRRIHKDTKYKRTVSLFGLRIPLYFGKLDTENAEIKKEAKSPVILGTSLPFYFETVTAKYYTVEEYTPSQEEKREYINRAIKEFESLEFKDSKILDRQVTVFSDKTTINYSIEKDIAKERVIITS